MEWDVSGSRCNLPLLDNMRDISGPLELAGFESAWCHSRFLRPKPDAHRMYAQDQVVIHTVRM
jgi:hypothetical protein